jgi:hypothetical protein
MSDVRYLPGAGVGARPDNGELGLCAKRVCLETALGHAIPEGRPLVVPNRRVVGSVLTNELHLPPIDLLIRCIDGVPKNLFTDSEVQLLLKREVRTDQLTGSTSEVVHVVNQILADVDLSIGVGDLIDRL